VVKEVWPYLTAGAILTLVLALTAPIGLAAAAAALTLAVASFFRDPRREVPVDPRLVLSPADGRVVCIKPDPQGSPAGTKCISIFLSVFNVHVNRSPVAGRITGIDYTPGSFIPAFREKASELNEQNHIAMQTDNGPFAVKQIAGLIARRIRCWKSPGDEVGQGEKIGFITFGSRVDLYVPSDIDVLVKVGDKVRGGLTVVAARGRAPSPRGTPS